VRSGPVAISALAANEAQFYIVSATGSSLGAVAAGLDLAYVAGLINKLDGYFVTSARIRSPEDLKGKAIGVQSIGGGIWMFTQMALDHWGLSTERDKIQMRVLGDQSVLAQAMSTGLLASLRKSLRLSPSEGGEELYERMRILYDRRIVPSREGIQNALRVLSKADPKFAKLKADDLIDDRIARKLEQ
jgi:hypothetical protein